MNHKHQPIERFCRLNGQMPTLRERWIAFHRLYRIVSKHERWASSEPTLSDSLRVFSPRWTALMNCEGDTIGSRARPKFLRRSLIEGERRRRLHGNHPEWSERDKVVANLVRNQHGMEVTPDEVAVVRRKVINIARKKAVELGITLPADDGDVLRLLKS